MSLAKCPSCNKQGTTWYECLKCHSTICNACYGRSGNKCPSCGHNGKKNAKKP
ncbi:MAG: hypothetical protein HQK84_07040 [Nitrospinae bacterium]|nr:hypothetical protein [Nitrospinota bacterium]